MRPPIREQRFPQPTRIPVGRWGLVILESMIRGGNRVAKEGGRHRERARGGDSIDRGSIQMARIT